jgi:hypothetical protein
MEEASSPICTMGYRHRKRAEWEEAFCRGCPSQDSDTSDKNPSGRLTANILICMAEFQLSLIREATLAASNRPAPAA